MKLSWHCIPMSKYLSLIFGGLVGGGGSKYHTIIFWPPPPINKKCQPWTRIVWDIYMFWVMKLSWHCIPMSKYLSLIFGGWMGGSKYHTIIFWPPPPINKKCQPWTRIVWDVYMFWVMKLSWHCIPMSKYLSLIFGGWVGGVKISYHNILTQ